MKRYLTSILLWFSLLLSELHTFWENASKEKYNWIIDKFRPMTLQWNIKMVTDQLWIILIFVAMLFYDKNRINRTTVLTFICFGIIDTAMYFINYKTYQYSIVYFILTILWVSFYAAQGKKKQVDSGSYLYEQLNY